MNKEDDVLYESLSYSYGPEDLEEELDEADLD
jgi:hypothetical protein